MHLYSCLKSSVTTAHAGGAAPLPWIMMFRAVLCQVDKDMIEVLQATWLDGHLAALREEGRKYEK
jgi:hypothetical protein